MTAQGQGDQQRRRENDELLEAFALKHLADVLQQKRRAQFSGSVAVKFELQAGLVRQVHTDDHNLVTGDMLRRAAR